MKIRRFMTAILLGLTLLLSVAHVAASPPAGTGPDDALVSTGEWQPIEPDSSRWYTFYYAGDGTQVEVRLDVEPQESATFALWTPEEIERWRLGLEVEPVGRGAPDPATGGDLLWTGSFTTEGAYYVLIEHAGTTPGPGYYLLQIDGSSVAASVPADPAANAAEPTTKPSPAGPVPLSKPQGKLAFQTSVGGDIYVIGVDGSGLRRVADGMDPTWSPNGQEVAFVRWQEPRGVWVVNVQNGNEWRAFDWNEARWPSWSPDGERLLFSRQHEGRLEEVERCFWRWCFTLPPAPHWKLGIVRTVDATLTEPPCSDFSRAPHWSPAGDRFVYADEHGLRVQSLVGSVSYLITDDPRDTSPVWSPDGTQVAFVRRQHDHWELYRVDADGRNLTRLTDTPRQPNGEVGHSASPTWSPDGQYLAFLTDRTGQWEIWLLSAADGSQQRPMFEGALDGLTLDYAHLGERALSWTR